MQISRLRPRILRLSDFEEHDLVPALQRCVSVPPWLNRFLAFPIFRFFFTHHVSRIIPKFAQKTLPLKLPTPPRRVTFPDAQASRPLDGRLVRLRRGAGGLYDVH